MVLPGARTDPRTPGGMPDSGRVNPGGPMPSMPKMGPGPGPTAPGVPDPGKIEELFDQYTSGQITRQDLISQLHTFSEGQGGILGLLEGMQEQPDQGMPGMQPQQPTQPGQPMQGMQPGQPPQPGALPGSPQGPGVGGDPMIAPGAAKTPIPSLTETLDARHQQISLMLQGFGLGPADADQMSTLLNPHNEFHKKGTEETATTGLVWSEEEQLWTDPSGGIGYDPTISGTEGAGSQAAQFRLQAGLGEETGDVAAGYVGGKLYGEKGLFDLTSEQGKKEDYWAKQQSLTMPGQISGYRQVDYDQAAVQAEMEKQKEERRMEELGYQAQQEPEALAGEGAVGATPTQGLYTDPATGKTYFNGREVTKGGKVSSALPLSALPPDKTQTLSGYGGETPEEMEIRLAKEKEETALAVEKGLLEEARLATAKAKGLDFGEGEDADRLSEWSGTGAKFHPFFGGSYDFEKYKAIRTGGAGGKPDLISFVLDYFQNPKFGAAKPYQDPETKEWFPTENAFKEYTKWTESEDAQLWGMDIKPEFSHYENETGHKVTEDSQGVWRLDDGKKWEGPKKGNLTAVPKGVRQVEVKWIENGREKSKTYNIPTYGFTETELIKIESLMVNQFYIPWGKDGDSAGAHFITGYGPGGLKGLNIKLPRVIPKLGNPGKTYKKGQELPEGWSFVDQPGGAEGGEITVLYDEFGNIVGSTPVLYGEKEGGTITSKGMPDSDVPFGGGYLGQDAAVEAGLTGTRAAGAAGVPGMDDLMAPAKPWTTETELIGGDYPIFQGFVRNLEAGALSSPEFMSQLADVIGELEMMTAKGEQAVAAGKIKTVADAMVAKAAVTKEELDRDLQAGAAIGDIAGKATLAAQMEETANIFRAADAAGVIPIWTPGTAGTSPTDPGTPGKWTLPTAPTAEQIEAGTAVPGSLEAQRVGLEGERVDIEGRVVGEQEAAGKVTEQDKLRQRELDFSQVFGEYIRLTEGTDVTGTAGAMGAGVSPEATMQTLEKQKFGLTLALAKAEQTGVFDISAPGTGKAQASLIAGTTPNDQDWLNRFFTQGNPEDLSAGWVAANLSTEGKRVQKQIQAGINAGTGITGVQTLSAKRLAFEIDMGNRAADNVDRLATIAEETNLNQMQLSQNRINMDGFIAGGQLAEAVEARKDATWLAAEGLRIQREKMKLDTLQSLNDPATYLFAVRYGLLEQIGSVLGIDWGDDVITSAQLPTMVAPGTFPSRQEFENATQIDQRIMLAEYASSQGFTIEQAGLTILGGTPGGRAIRRPSVLGAAR